MITTTDILCDLFTFLDKDQIERIQIVNQSWNNFIINYKKFLPLRQFDTLDFDPNQIYLFATTEEERKSCASYKIKFDGTSLSKIEEGASSRYSQLTVDEVLNNLNNVVYERILLDDIDSEDRLDYYLNMMELVTTKTGGRFCGKFGECDFNTADLDKVKRLSSKLTKILDNYIIVDELNLLYLKDSYIRDVCANPEIVQLPSTPKKIRLDCLEFKTNEEVSKFTCNGELNGANRVTIAFYNSDGKYGNFIRQWFELYRTHQNPISLVGKFETDFLLDSALYSVKTFLINTQLRVKYSLEVKKFLLPYHHCREYLIRRCVLHETDSYALAIEIVYKKKGIDISCINVSDLNQPPCDKMKWISFCVKSL